ncbi:MAG: methylenetetrahydromethanopterin dehydrogenase [Synergistaceae bacterium]|jgi:threonine dehydrogenase-like Zn-dependent dehydrogenase|nr:methylenetetrahydromethanopterin dehydrogenase [Synergistaceae bacterium]
MRKILLQLDSAPQPSVFDAITALDSEDCVMLRHGGVTDENVVPLVHGCMFTRSPRDIGGTAIFIGGSSVEESEKILKKVRHTLWSPFDASVMFDPNGCNTTSAAAVRSMTSACCVKGKKVVILSGTGPVGQRSAGLFMGLGASVLITSRNIDKAKTVADAVRERFGSSPDCAVMRQDSDLPSVLDGAVAVLCCGAAGVRLIPESIWKEHPTLKVVADVNAVPPLGAEAVETGWYGREESGKLLYGAIGIGGLKMKIHHRAVARLFESKGLVLDTESIYELAASAE